MCRAYRNQTNEHIGPHKFTLYQYGWWTYVVVGPSSQYIFSFSEHRYKCISLIDADCQFIKTDTNTRTTNYSLAVNQIASHTHANCSKRTINGQHSMWYNFCGCIHDHSTFGIKRKACADDVTAARIQQQHPIAWRPIFLVQLLYFPHAPACDEICEYHLFTSNIKIPE